MPCYRYTVLGQRSKHGILSACRDNPSRLNLALNDAVKNEVSNTYKQYIKSNGRRLLLQVPEFYSDSGLKVIVNPNITAVLVPIDANTIATLQEIEAFVRDNVDSPVYKPLRLDDSFYVNLSKWCRYVLLKSDGTQIPLPEGTVLGKGLYKLELQISHVYIGPHRGGETFSLSLHITRVVYEPEENIFDFVELVTPPPTAPPAVLPVSKPKPKRNRRRVGLDEVDAPKPCPPTPVKALFAS